MVPDKLIFSMFFEKQNQSLPPLEEREGGFWIGGDAYTAVAVAKKVGTGSWTVYNIFRNHLGTITHLKEGSNTTEYSFDAWGRRRDKDDWTYTLTSEPDLFAGRGFTAHEYLEDFKLYNMNGRLYDPVVGRFLNADPVIQDPGFTQSYNRYSYALNNPLKYTDPSGYQIPPRQYRAEGPDRESGTSGSNWMANFGEPGYAGWAGIFSDGVSQSLTPHLDKARSLSNRQYAWRNAPSKIGNDNTVWIQLGFYYYDSNGNPIANKYGNSGEFRIYEASIFNSVSDVSGQRGSYSIDNAVNWLNENSHPTYSAAKEAGDQSRCAYFVRMALEAGGINTTDHPVPARLYGSYLQKWGFSPVNNTNDYIMGDIAVIQGYLGGTADSNGVPYGHIQMYNGTQWLSSWKQVAPFWPGPRYEYNQPAFQIYRWGTYP